MPGDLVMFGDRLRDALHHRGADATQAWLSERSGVDRSLISRIVKNDRIPTLDTLQSLAPALGIDLRELVAGTNAESRLQEGADHVRRSDYEDLLQLNIVYSAKTRELEETVHQLEQSAQQQASAIEEERRGRRVAEAQRSDLEASCDRLAAQAAKANATVVAMRTELHRYKTALHRALAQFSALKVRVDELQRELGETRKTSKAGAILSGVAALAGVATLGYFLRDDDDADGSNPTRKKKK
jgi:transcriptional regulator with XRE-family HTH domain